MTEISTSGIRIAGARLLVLTYDGKCTATTAMAAAPLQSGDLVLQLVRHGSLPELTAVLAMVGDIQWPVGKDSVVIKFDGSPASFCFFLAGSLGYRLILPEPTTEHQILQLQSFLSAYATLVTASEQPPESANEIIGSDKRSSASSSLNDPADKLQQARIISAVSKLFYRSLEKGAISPSAHVKLDVMADQNNNNNNSNRALDRDQGKAWNQEIGFYRQQQQTQGGYQGQEKTGTDSGRQGLGSSSEQSNRGHHQQQERSGDGAVKQQALGFSTQQNYSRDGYDINEVQGKAGGDSEKQRLSGISAEQGRPGLGFLHNVAVAKVEAVAKLAEAVRTGGKTLMMTDGDCRTNQLPFMLTNAQKCVNDAVINNNQVSSVRSWTLNEAGLRLLFRFIATSVNTCNNSSGSLSSSMPRLLSPSSSSSAEQRLSSSELPYLDNKQTQAQSIKIKPQSRDPTPQASRRPPRPTPRTALK